MRVDTGQAYLACLLLLAGAAAGEEIRIAQTARARQAIVLGTTFFSGSEISNL